MFSTVYASTSRWITALLGAFLNPAGTGSSSTTVHVSMYGRRVVRRLGDAVT
jgi:hypothetical protein